PSRRPDGRVQEEASRSGPGEPDDPHGHLRRRPRHRRNRPRRCSRRGPACQPGPLRRLQRHRPSRGVLRESLGLRLSGASNTPSAWPRSPRSGSATATAGPTTTARSPRARPQRGPSGPWGGRSATRSTAASGPTPAIPRKARARALEATGNDCVARPAGSHPGLACGRGPGPRRLRDPPVSWLKSWWREENFLKYASANYGIDAICDYIAAIETNTKITGNPARKTAAAAVRTAKAALASAQRDLAALLRDPAVPALDKNATLIPAAQDKITSAERALAAAETARDRTPAK